ncbi:MAG: hypothetical protein JWO35_150 [Candidatus Saccharibacteria bacterium]|nr:hypothetical protein [Candidatus Saccharibacteria bacterium]
MQLASKLVQSDFVRFCVVGSSGFSINFVILTVLYKGVNFPIFMAQLIACEVSLFTNFLLHHHWTYKHKHISKNIKSLLWQFHASSWVAIIGISAMVSFCVKVLEFNYIVALAVSSIIALGWNFYWSKYVIWRHQHE